MIRENFFNQAFRLAKSVKGRVSPNPAVGAVIVKDGKIVGRGSTRPAGGAHAEIIAIQEAGNLCRGAEMFVTLEPCVDFPGKRTPACTDAIIKAGIRKVRIGMQDPNPHINGKGIRLLQKAGIQVETEAPNQELQELNEDFFKYIRTRTPFVTAKYAMTLDGNIASASGESKWITNEKSRNRVQEIRSTQDAILVGIGTVLRDNPRLNVRLPKANHQPLRIIIDPNCQTDEKHEVMTGENPTLFVVKNATDSFRELTQRYKKQILEFKGPIHMKALMQVLGSNYQLSSVLIEGGSRVLYRAYQESVIDKVIVFIAPKILGGQGIPPFFGKSPDMNQALKLKRIRYENFDQDLMIQGYVHEPKT